MNLLDMTINEASAKAPYDPRWSEFQTAIFDGVQDSADPILIEAVAGSGKTTTIIEATQYCADPVIFLAFAKSNALDVAGKLKKGEAKTLNALGHRMWMRNAPRAKLDSHKDDAIIAALLSDELRKKFGYTVGRLVSAAKHNGYALGSSAKVEDFEEFIAESDWADVEDKDLLEVASAACRVFDASRRETATFNFDDQLYGPLYHNWDFQKFGTVLVDEAQDLNRVQHFFVEELVLAGARLIAVGDRNQAIYGFRGALTNSMDLLKSHFRMREFPLSISYRCPTSVIAEAQQLVPHIQARADAPPGKVMFQERLCKEQDELEAVADPEFWPDGHLIVCRNNAPLFAAVMRSVRARRPCRVLSNALDGLESFIRRFRCDNTYALIQKIERWKEKESLAASAKGFVWKIAAIEDKADTVISLCEGFQRTEDVLALISQLKNGRSGPLFATIHKAKGLEADHVYFLRPDLVPGWWITAEEQLQQEHNLRYVAITRAKQTLTYGVKIERRQK